jgi:hypothetical protein
MKVKIQGLAAMPNPVFIRSLFALRALLVRLISEQRAFKQRVYSM